jgi:hypothetical protein
VNDDQARRSGFKSSSELLRGDFTGQNRAHAGTKRFRRPTRPHVLRQHDDRISSKDFFSHHFVYKRLPGFSRGLHQQDVRFHVVELLGK